ncbi:microtubule organization protein AKNA isoform X1 [Cricetulus griseus]|uniref:microtubule organization protein AKNA isoform X1 n=1 Tax=Cricetulus griseus TaxID=10029 RepID=UPI00022F4D98|nr:microtubule organization protein AKNA isoform X1 [Cricetulus griseus]XP_007642254.1 microtubule organization protein AKNA isoform X1 [Cricetulus griseus]XP_016831617.1 microtubule organization protein AKNA isoform X1 [Cricetulus griseus]XP_035312434.1 microtubule organization protein AKNA isoform X1 [Cricetulus griseus]
MASSGTEAHWAGPGLGQGPQRRRWAWAEEQYADGSSDQGWGNEQSLPKTTSPELLEDFRQAQEHPPPLEWDPGMQEFEESSGEETEADEASSPEGSTLPLPWHSRHNPQLDLSEEELDEAPGSLEAELAEESCTELECEDPGNSSPVALEQGPAGDWVASIKQGSKHRPSEHPKVHPSVEQSPAKSWSSGTVSLGQPSDSLGSTWEGDTDCPQPATLAEALPQRPCHNLPQPDDRNGDGVAPVTPTEFRDSLAAPAQNPQCSAGTWGRETTTLPSSQLENRTWKRAKASPKPLPSRFTGSISPPSTRLGAVKKVVSQHNQGAILAGHSSSAAPKYGRGRLNYPLPDFSKVGPRVKFPKDENYRPPKSRGRNRQQDPTRPLIFKSPAEIVREVLLSSGERSLAKDPSLAHPITRVPQEFQTPEQATELVHQLQEDYHKLLTKYAEAENTIDQLRLGAKVHLYSDPPQPSQSICSGSMPQGSKVLSFSIPQPRSAEWWPGPEQNPQASEATGWSSPRADLSPSSSPSMVTPRRLPQSQGIATDQPTTGQTQALSSQASRLLAKVESFKELVLAGHLPPQDQIKSLEQLRVTHGALEAEYLEACRQQHLNPKSDASTGSPRTLNLCRELEAEIYHLGQHLEELQDHMDQTQREAELCSPDLQDNTRAMPFLSRSAHLPTPSGSFSSPAVHTNHEPAATATSPRTSFICPMNKKVSLGSIKVEAGLRELPGPLRDKELQVEQDFHGLLEQYLSVKSLPEALSVEDEEDLEEKEEQDHHGTLEFDGPATAPEKAEATRVPPRQHPAQIGEGYRAAIQEDEEQVVSMKLPSFRTSMATDRYAPGLDTAEVAQRGTKPIASHQSSIISLEENGPTELLRKALLRTGTSHIEEPWMVSPETDSGFVDSETSIVSPFTQTPEHQLSHVSAPGTSAQHLAASVPGDGASHPKARGSVVPRRSTEAATPRSRTQQHHSCLSSSLRQGAHRSQLEQAPVVKMGSPMSEFKRQKQISKQLLPSRATSPASTPTPAAASVPHGSAESMANLLLIRTERDQAIKDLQAEVSQLRLRLGDSLHRPHPSSPTHVASAFNHSTRTEDKLLDSSPSWSSHYGSKSTERLSGESDGTEPAVPTGRQRARSSSVPRDVPRLFLSSESESFSSRLSSGKSRTFEEHPQAAREGTRSSGSMRRKERVSFQGQYTGQEYHILSPKAVLKDSGTASCLHCQPIRTQDPGSAVPREPSEPSTADTLRCPTCGIVRSTAEADGPSSSTSEKKTERKTAPSTPSPKRKSRQMGSPVRPLSGLWYLAAAPPVPAPPALAYISSAPIMPYPPPTVYYATPAPTSARTASSQPAQGPRGTRHSVHLGLNDLEELQAALSEAARAAENVRSTTRQLSRSLSADLRHARSLRGSCLF